MNSVENWLQQSLWKMYFPSTHLFYITMQKTIFLNSTESMESKFQVNFKSSRSRLCNVIKSVKKKLCYLVCHNFCFVGLGLPLGSWIGLHIPTLCQASSNHKLFRHWLTHRDDWGWWWLFSSYFQAFYLVFTVMLIAGAGADISRENRVNIGAAVTLFLMVIIAPIPLYLHPHTDYGSVTQFSSYFS